MKLNTSANPAKCEMTDACTRDAVGTVRLRFNPPGDDRQTCREHAGDRVIWEFGKRSPYGSRA